MYATIQEDKVVAQSEWSEEIFFEKLEKLPIFLNWKKKTVGIMSESGEHEGYVEPSGCLLIKKIGKEYAVVSVFDEKATYYWGGRVFGLPSLSASKRVAEMILKLMGGNKIVSHENDHVAYNRMCDLNRMYRKGKFREFFQQMVNIAFME
jgi:hypothetical protein